MQRHGADSPREPAEHGHSPRRAALLTLAGLTLAATPLATSSATAATPSGGMTFSAAAAPAPAPSPAPAPAPAAPTPSGEAAAPADPVAAADPAATTAAPAVPVTRTVPLTRSQTRSVQRRVKVRPDGVLGSQTRTALRRYQASHSLMRTGRPNVQTLRAMKLGFAETIATRLVTGAHVGAPTVVDGHTFPIRGAWRFGGAATVFGANRGHQGNDMFAACGTPIVAASAGTVKVNKTQSRAGYYVVLTDTPSGEDHVYMHMESPSTLAVGARVEAGSTIGYVGDTGRASGCHLHFEIWTAPGWYSGGSARDPRKTLETWASTTGTKPNSRAGR